MTVTGAERRSPSPLGPDRSPSPSAAARHGGPAWAGVCPFLTTEAGSWRSAHASAEHRCGAVDPATPVAPATQRSLCLGPAHGSCATYLAAAAAMRPIESSADQPSLWPSARPAPLLVLDQVHAVRVPLAGGRGRAGQATLVVLMIAAFIAIGVARTGLPSASAGDASQPPATAAALVDSMASATPPASRPPSPSPAASAPSTPAPSAPPSEPPSQSPGASASPASSETPSSSPSAVAGQHYTVKSGDTLSAIAARFHTTVHAIAAANALSDPRLIRIGEVLIIPTP